MLKAIFRTIGIIVLAVIIFLAISLWKGGDPFRWFGSKSERAGEILREKSEELGKEADKIRQQTDSVITTTKKVKEELRKTEEKVRKFTGGETGK